MRLTALCPTLTLTLAYALACTPRWMTAPADHPVSVYDAPPLAGAAYFAQVYPGDFGNPGPHVALEHGRYQCRELLDLQSRDRDPAAAAAAAALGSARATCPAEIADALGSATGFLFVVDGTGARGWSTDQLVAAAVPIDSPAKALFAAWVRGYEVSWYDGVHDYGSLEDGRVRAVSSGYEIAGGASTTEGSCDTPDHRVTTTNFRVTLLVDRAGTVRETARTKAHEGTEMVGPCHEL